MAILGGEELTLLYHENRLRDGAAFSWGTFPTFARLFEDLSFSLNTDSHGNKRLMAFRNLKSVVDFAGCEPAHLMNNQASVPCFQRKLCG